MPVYMGPVIGKRRSSNRTTTAVERTGGPWSGADLPPMSTVISAPSPACWAMPTTSGSQMVTMRALERPASRNARSMPTESPRRAAAGIVLRVAEHGRPAVDGPSRAQRLVPRLEIGEELLALVEDPATQRVGFAPRQTPRS